ncbi:NAD(P)-binding domain-containing protein [Micromonospora sp. NPDC050417]|uniref:NAD(P)-binding domain-containing protein n=1 Tax=Micromonospora sp. NPDC050417 TaxID=3364280 RepID=UPI0037969145
MTCNTTFLGLGAMGGALATASLDADRTIIVWNRTPHRAERLAGRGAIVARTVEEAVEGDGVIVACLLDHRSVHDVLDPVAARLSGRTLVNVTTTTPSQARDHRLRTAPPPARPLGREQLLRDRRRHGFPL